MGKINDTNWFGDLLMKFAPTSVDIEGKTPDEMISSASWKAFGISTAAALPPGPIGWATIIPELLAVTKIQMNLIYKIATYYEKEKKLNQTIIMLIFANEAGLAVGRQVVKKVGTRLIINALGSKAIRPIAQKIAARIGARLTQKFIGRWIPFILAPLFGAYSKSMTTKIGQEAVRFFEGDFVVVETTECKNGHEVAVDVKFCPECGTPMEQNNN
jgi:hypothetical protein